VHAIFMKNLLKTYWGAWLLVGLWLVLQYAGGPMLWDYARPAIAEGEYWRLLSAHFVQLNTAHLVLNLLGLLAVLGVWGDVLRGIRPMILAVGIALGISLGLWFNETALQHYAGASGVLHGLFAAGIVLARRLDWRLRLLAAIGLIAKLVAETQFNTGSAALIGAPVIHASHQWGALFGALIAGLYTGFSPRRRR
jgi:rhomboid family GlyGly-CTERM serine protease